MKKKQKETIKDKILNLLNSYKTIIVFSFLINIILIIFSYNIITNNHEYIFDCRDDYVSIKDVLIVLNNDVNLLYGNNIKYINEKDYEMKSLTMGYYIMNDNKMLDELIKEEYSFDESIMLSEIINNCINFKIIEKNDEKGIFTSESVNDIYNNFFFVLEGKDIDGSEIKTKLKLNVTKISKF